VLEDRTVPTALAYSTYLGGAVEAIAVGPGDTTGAVYAASGGSVLKLNNGGTGLVYGTCATYVILAVFSALTCRGIRLQENTR
jgi:hypothetical protein